MCVASAEQQTMTTLDSFVVRRWRGQVGWRTLFWRDLLLVGTGFSVVTTLVALGLLSQGASTITILAVHLLSLPYGLFIVAALWRLPNSPALVRGVGMGWLALSVLI
jgi:hypothetical protein